jgi:hypothetical protein
VLVERIKRYAAAKKIALDFVGGGEATACPFLCAAQFAILRTQNRQRFICLTF